MMTKIRGTAFSLAFAFAVSTLPAYGQTTPNNEDDADKSSDMPSKEKIEAVPLGDLAGTAASSQVASIKNPYSGGVQAITVGESLYVAMNCAGCHAYGGTGNMGPDLTDTYWRYGGTPVRIYKSISEGRPQGMPAWARILPPSQIWQITAYIESLGGSTQAADYHPDIQGDQPDENVAPETAAQ